jgi:hypothetical protein
MKNNYQWNRKQAHEKGTKQWMLKAGVLKRLIKLIHYQKWSVQREENPIYRDSYRESITTGPTDVGKAIRVYK